MTTQPELGVALRYAAVGLVGNAIALGVFAVLADSIGVSAAATLSFITALAHNFAWNRSWTFDAAHLPAIPQAARFVIVQVAFLLVSLGILHLLIAFGTDDVVAQALAMVAVAVPNFLSHRWWSFGAPRSG